MANAQTLNLALPGNPRYQPKALVPYFGYDHLMRGLGRVEIATLQTLGNLGFIPAEDIALLTTELCEQLLAITTTEVDRLERQVTKHDVRAWVRLAQDILPPQIGRWVHVPLTSYDALDSGRILHYVDAYREATRPAICEVIKIFAQLVQEHAKTLQMGRTHGQHALPITVGFWLATILNRVISNTAELDRAASGLVGKISGAVGAYNAQVGLGIDARCRSLSFEKLVLEKLGLKPAPISTQILPPEPLARFLINCGLLSAAFGQFGRDGRNLMRSEIAEVAEAFEAGQVGSSTMAQKRNPLFFENIEGMWLRTKSELGKVLDTLVSEHQRDLVGSCVMRDFPVIMVNLQCQLDTLLRKSAAGTAFLTRIMVSPEACQRNFSQSEFTTLAEPLYIALMMAGYTGDAHELVNRVLVPLAQKERLMLIQALMVVADKDKAASQALQNMNPDIKKLLSNPEKYTGLASEKALAIASQAEQFITA